jgi:hypothetical protein
VSTTGMGPLDLSGADMDTFEAVPPGRYNVEVFEVTMDAVRNARGDGKLPAGTPMLKIQWRATEDNPDGLNNRRFWSQFVIPPKDYDKSKADKMKGMLARTLIALGEPEEKVLAKGYEPDLEDLVGRAAVIQVGREQKLDSNTREPIEGEFNNPVKGVKPAGSITASSDSDLL